MTSHEVADEGTRKNRPDVVVLGGDGLEHSGPHSWTSVSTWRDFHQRQRKRSWAMFSRFPDLETISRRSRSQRIRGLTLSDFLRSVLLQTIRTPLAVVAIHADGAIFPISQVDSPF